MKFKPNIQLFASGQGANLIASLEPYGSDKRRDIDRIWENIVATKLGTNGILGYPYDKEKLYIQDEGEKHAGYVYMDKNDSKIYVCTKSTSTVSNVKEYFTEHTLKRIHDSIPLQSIYQSQLFTLTLGTAPSDIPDSNVGMNTAIIDLDQSTNKYTQLYAGFMITSGFNYGNNSFVKLGLISWYPDPNGKTHSNDVVPIATAAGTEGKRKLVSFGFEPASSGRRPRLKIYYRGGYNTLRLSFFSNWWIVEFSELLGVAGYEKNDLSQIPEEQWF